MSKIISIEPAIDPNARPTFLLDWELTLKCNLDCSYCPTEGQWRAHDNSEAHPDLESCLNTIDFMFEYVDTYMKHKPKWNRAVILNIYGGESLFHPDIETILTQVRQKYTAYQDQWPLTVTCTTNGVIGSNRLEKIVDLIDEFTVSYHCESLPKQKQQVLTTLSTLKSKNKKMKCVILMHGDYQRWNELLDVMEFCKSNDIRYLPRQLDGSVNSNYNEKQIKWFENLWQEKTPHKGKHRQSVLAVDKKDDSQLSKVGRACCGGRTMCLNQEMKEPVFYIPNNHFPDWYCSVNWFFLFVRQTTKEIFTNKDCRMSFNETLSPIGNLDEWKSLVEWTKLQLANKTLPVIRCKRERCYCGLCAPKSSTLEQYQSIMTKHCI